MSTDLDDFRSTTDHRRPGRILYHAHYTPDVADRIAKYPGRANISWHYDAVELSGHLKNTPPAPDYSAYWKGELENFPRVLHQRARRGRNSQRLLPFHRLYLAPAKCQKPS